IMQKVGINISKIRQDFPILKRKVNGNKRLVYLDNAATTQKPISVMNAIYNYYMNYNSNIHRAVHQLAEEATFEYEKTREKVAKFINARSADEIIFTRNATEAINLVSYSWGRTNINRDDRIVITEIEHHSNIVPWQILTQEKGAKLDYIGIDNNGYLNMEDCKKYLQRDKVKLLSISHMSNVLGTIVPINEIIELAHQKGIVVLVDGAQSVPHMSIGVQYAKKEILSEMQPFIGGGDMIKEVYKHRTIYNDLPYKFEGGTPNIADVIGFGAAIDYLKKIGMDNVREHEIEITDYAIKAIVDIKDIVLYGPSDASHRGGVIAFNIGDIHPHDLATIMNDHGIAIRSGHHCAQVLMGRLDIAAASRTSFYIYNTKEEVDKFIHALGEARRIFRI